MSYPLTMAKKISYGGTRSLNNILYIVLHNTGNVGDTAKNNVRFFASGNTRSAGAHFFVSRDGDVQQSIPIKYIAYSVGDSRNGHGTYYGKCTNSNSVSIEMCDIASKDASDTQIAAVRTLIAYIKSQCPNIKDIIRHYDVTTKSCPARYLSSAKWNKLKSAVTGGTVTTTAYPTEDEKLIVDGYVGPKTVAQWQRTMGTPHDGEISGQPTAMRKYHLNFTNTALVYGVGGSQLIRAVQTKLGVDSDGKLGPVTIKAIQDYLGVYADGYFGKKTATALQERLNTGRF